MSQNNKIKKTENQFVARQPLFNREKEVFAYELLYRDSETNAFPGHLTDQQATGRMFFETLLFHSLDKLADHKIAFINLCTTGMIRELPNLIAPDNIVIEILERVDQIDTINNFIIDMKKKGYHFALDDYDGNEKWSLLLEKVGIIKLEVQTPLIRTILLAKKLRRNYPKIKLLVERIEDYDTFFKLKEAGIDYFQGYFFSKPEMLNLTNINPTKTVILELLNLSTQPNIDFKRVQNKVAKDLSLTTRVLKMANINCRTSSAGIGSLTQAISYLGEDKLRQFISVLAMSELGQDKPSELMKLGLVRAQYLKLMLANEHQDKADTGYLVGLLSVLDAVLDNELSNIISEFKLNQECEQALLACKGVIGQLLQICFTIEQDELHNLTIEDISTVDSAEAYIQALFYADNTLAEIT